MRKHEGICNIINVIVSKAVLNPKEIVTELSCKDAESVNAKSLNGLSSFKEGILRGMIGCRLYA